MSGYQKDTMLYSSRSFFFHIANTFSPFSLQSVTSSYLSFSLPSRSKLAPRFQRTCFSPPPHRPQTEKTTQSLIALWAEIPRRFSTFQKRKSSKATQGFSFRGNVFALFPPTMACVQTLCWWTEDSRVSWHQHLFSYAALRCSICCFWQTDCDRSTC